MNSKPTPVTTRPIYTQPTRDLAIEAAIFVAVYEGGLSHVSIGGFVQRHFHWAKRSEIYARLDAMVRAGRVIARLAEGRAYPVFYLPSSR